MKLDTNILFLARIPRPISLDSTGLCICRCGMTFTAPTVVDEHDAGPVGGTLIRLGLAGRFLFEGSGNAGV